MHARYGINVDTTGADERSVSEALARAQQARSEADNERTKASAARTDKTVAGAAIAGADKEGTATQKMQAEAGYDSPERRHQLGRKPRRKR